MSSPDTPPPQILLSVPGPAPALPGAPALVDQVQAPLSRDKKEAGRNVVGRGSGGGGRDWHTPVHVLPDEQAADGVEGQVCRGGARWEEWHSMGGLAMSL